MRAAVFLPLAGLLAGCSQGFDWMQPSVNRVPVEGRMMGALTHFTNMSDSTAMVHVVSGIESTVENNSWRWTGKHPILRFGIQDARYNRLYVDYAVPPNTFEHTGPVTLDLRVNGHPVEIIHVGTPGMKHYEHRVPAEWLSVEDENIVSIEIDKTDRYPLDGHEIGFVLTRAGFLQ